MFEIKKKNNKVNNTLKDKYIINDNGWFCEYEKIAEDSFLAEDGIADGTDLQTVNTDGKIQYWLAFKGTWYNREFSDELAKKKVKRG